MAMKRYLLVAVLSFWVVSHFFQNRNVEGREGRPNIITILVDDLGYSDIGCFGGEIETPHLDSLAENGVRLTQFYNTSRCCPSRASLLTGLYQHQAGIGFMTYRDYGKGYRPNLNDQCVTFGEVLKSAGYQTSLSGKWHVGHTDKAARPEVRGFDKFTGIYSHVDSYWKVLKGCDIYRDQKLLIQAQENPVNPYHPEKEFYTTDFFTDVAIDYIDQSLKKPDQPFLLHLCYNVPHFPLETPEDLIEKYRGRYLKGWDVLQKEKLDRMKKMGLVSRDQVLAKNKGFVNEFINGFSSVGVDTTPLPAWDSLSEEDKKELDFRRAMYAGQVDNLDQNIGRLIQHLKQKKVFENTVIMFMSDNGCSGETGLFGMNWKKYNSSNYKRWRKIGGWSISQGQCWAAYSNAPFKKYKKFVHEGGIASPFIFHWPKGIKNKGLILKDRAFHLIDIMPTLCELAGANYPEAYRGKSIPPMEGINLLPSLLEPQSAISKRALFWQHENHSAVREGDWKLVTNDDRAENRWELYNLKGDRSESLDLAKKHPERVRALKEKWTAWAKRVDALPFPEARQHASQKPTIYKTRKGTTLATSHVFKNDTLRGVLDKTLPKKSNDKSQPKHTFWPRKGTREWMQVSFREPQKLRSVSVYWYDDSGRGGCRVPDSWRLVYFDEKAKKWKPVDFKGQYGTEIDKLNKVEFKTVESKRFKLEIRLQKGFSAGVLEWKVGELQI